MKRAVDRLARAMARPLLVEDAVRTALRDTIAWRIGGGAAPHADAFIAAAVAAARQTLDASEADSAERSRTLHLVHQAAKRFTASPLSRRVMSVPASQFVRLARAADGPDTIVRDRRGRLHAIALRFAPDMLDAGRIASAVTNAAQLRITDRLNPLTVHIFSLATGRRGSYEREARPRKVEAQVA